MYLYRQQYAHPELKENLRLERAGKITTFAPERRTFLREEIGYWRKANHIHRWFVENVQEGSDDGHDYYVDRSELEELLKLVIKVLKHSKLVPGTVPAGRRILQNGEIQDTWEDGSIIDNPELAETLLPRLGGCFFGSLDYDQDYVNELRHTKSLNQKIMKDSNIFRSCG